nr:zf-HC2 domain-containing protein [Kibdelosporangium sp. MJ126-NF4]CEL18698.1 possible anti-sigma factor [Kibdelosporangium sp. MJ126-NF4]CTQ98182.1 possible anti-sigma factor [Kibdelosporangium sp. MJ126-NF4]
MNRDEHRTLRESLGPFALDLLDATGRIAVQSHLDGCAECRAELAEIAPLAGPLRRVDPARLASPPPPPEGLRESIMASVRARRRQPRPLVRVLAAAVVLLAVGLGIGYWIAPRPAPLPLEPVTVAVRQTSIDVHANLVAHTWGTEIKLDGTGFQRGRPYRVMIVDRNGIERMAGEFVGVGDKPMQCNLNSAVLRTSAAGFVVRDEADVVVVSSNF